MSSGLKSALGGKDPYEDAAKKMAAALSNLGSSEADAKRMVAAIQRVAQLRKEAWQAQKSIPSSAKESAQSKRFLDTSHAIVEELDRITNSLDLAKRAAIDAMKG